jgi:hypothetical protein
VICRLCPLYTAVSLQWRRPQSKLSQKVNTSLWIANKENGDRVCEQDNCSTSNPSVCSLIFCGYSDFVITKSKAISCKLTHELSFFNASQMENNLHIFRTFKFLTSDSSNLQYSCSVMFRETGIKMCCLIMQWQTLMPQAVLKQQLLCGAQNTVADREKTCNCESE